MKLSTFKYIIDRSDLEIYMFYTGVSEIEPNEIYPIVEKTLNEISKSVSYDELLEIVRNIFINFKEKELILNYTKKNELYSSTYINGELDELRISKLIGNDMEIVYEYFKEIGTSYSVNLKENLSNDNVYNYLLNDVSNKIKKLKKN